jgi:hypothetical protein
MPRDPKKPSIERNGQGQSGYAAGRDEDDPSLGIQGRNVSHPNDPDDPPDDVGDDERFTGRSGSRRAQKDEEEEGKDEDQEPTEGDTKK